MRAFFVVAGLAAVGVAVYVVSMSLPWQSAPLGTPRDVDVAITPKLSTVDAWHLGRNDGPQVEKGEFTDVVLERLPDSRLHLMVSEQRMSVVGYRVLTELWVSLDEDGEPCASAVVRSGPDQNSELSPFVALSGEVALSRGPTPGERESDPLVIEYELTGDYGGSPAKARGKVVVP